MKYKCEICGEKLTDENIRLIILKDAKTMEILEVLELCDECRPKYEYTIGVVNWEEQE